MSTMQVVMLIGRLGQDPEMRFLPDGRCVTRFTLATDRPVRAGAPPATDWHSVLCWDRTAEVAGEYLSKGRLVFVEGRLSYRAFEGRNGLQRTVTEIVAGRLVLLDRPSSPTRPPQQDDGTDGVDDLDPREPASAQAARPARPGGRGPDASTAKASAPAQGSVGARVPETDVPF